MSWPVMLALIVGSAVALMFSGLPIAFAFIVLDVVGVFFFWGGVPGLRQLVLSMANAAGNIDLVTVAMFVLMGEVMFHSGIAPRMIDTLDKWIGRMPGRLGLLAVVSGSILASLTGTSMASCAVLGETIVPESERRGYKKPMSLGPVLGSGGLAIMIPPSGLAVILGAIARISIGKILMAIIIPGLLMALFYGLYIVVRSSIDPSVAPPYPVMRIAFSEKLVATLKYILPLAFIVFMVSGVIFLGVATPSEAAATGALATFILAAVYGELTWQNLRKALQSTVRVSVMLLMILVGVEAFNQLLAYTGAARGMVDFVLSLNLPPVMLIVAIMAILIVLGCFMEAVSIMSITLPIFVPIIRALGFDPVWFAVIYLLNMEMATTTPPFGLNLFVMKGVAPAGTTMGDIYRAALPFLYCDAVVIVLLILFPKLTLWLPQLMR